MTHSIQEQIEQQFIISKLKKEAKVFKRENSEYSLMESQNIIAKKHGFLNWYELHSNIKKKLEKLNESNLFSLENKEDNILIGIESQFKENIYLNQYFQNLHIKDNVSAKNNIFKLFQQVINKSSRFIYCKTGLENNLLLEEDMINYAQSKQIDVHHLYCVNNTKLNNKKSLSINFNNVKSGFLLELFSSLIIGNEDGDIGMWKGRAIAMGASMFMALVYLRDKEGLELTPNVIIEYLTLDKFIELYNKNLPKHIHEGLKSYLFNLPGFKIEDYKQQNTAREMHGYLQMQYIKPLLRMSDCESYLFSSSDYSLNKILEENKKSLIIVHLPSSAIDKADLYTIFHCFLINILTNNSIEKNALNLHTYILKENIKNNIQLDERIKGLPIHFISNDDQVKENSVAFIKENIINL